VSMHSRQAAPENMNSAKTAMLEQISPTDGLEEGEAQKKKDIGHEIDRVLGEALRLSVRRVGDDTRGTGRSLRLGEKVPGEVQRERALDYVGADDGETVGSENMGNSAITGGGFPDPDIGSEALGPEQGFDGDRRC
jgi:hypothetical protein